MRLPGATVLGGGAFTEGVTLLPSPIVLGAAFVAVVTVGRDGSVGFGVVSLHATVMTAIVSSAAVPVIAANQRAFGRGGVVVNECWGDGFTVWHAAADRTIRPVSPHSAAGLWPV